MDRYEEYQIQRKYRGQPVVHHIDTLRIVTTKWIWKYFNLFKE